MFASRVSDAYERRAEKCPDVEMRPLARGRFELRVGCQVELVEKDTA
jgi:hypothetical protein